MMVTEKPSPYISFNLSFTPVIPNFLPSPAKGRVIKELCGSMAGIHRHLWDRIHQSWEDSWFFRWHFFLFPLTVSLFFMLTATSFAPYVPPWHRVPMLPSAEQFYMITPRNCCTPTLHIHVLWSEINEAQRPISKHTMTQSAFLPLGRSE